MGDDAVSEEDSAAPAAVGEEDDDAVRKCNGVDNDIFDRRVSGVVWTACLDNPNRNV